VTAQRLTDQELLATAEGKAARARIAAATPREWEGPREEQIDLVTVLTLRARFRGPGQPATDLPAPEVYQ